MSTANYPCIFVTTPANRAEEISWLLVDLGALGVEQRDHTTLDRPDAGRAELVAGRKRAAFEMAFDLIRFYDDFKRGDTKFLIAFLSTISQGHFCGIIEMALNQPEPIGEDLLMQVRAELSMLIETAPHPLSHLKAEFFIFLQILDGPIEDEGAVLLFRALKTIEPE